MRHYPLTVDLILFEPGRNVLYGMPLFIGTDVQLLRSLLRGHGEWWDNPSMWLAGYFDEPARFELRCMFNASGGRRHAKRLIPHLGLRWNIQSAAKERGITRAAGAEGSAFLSLTHAWVVYRDAMPQRMSASHPGQLVRQRQYWSPCDGAVALDISGLDALSPSEITTVVERLMTQPAMVNALRTRAECCFLFHLSHSPSEARRPSAWLDFQWKREMRLPGRHGRLIEADLLLDADVTTAGASRS